MDLIHRSCVECIDFPGYAIVRVYDVEKDTFVQRLRGKSLKNEGNFIGALQGLDNGECLYNILYIHPETCKSQIMATAAEFHQLECNPKALCFRPPHNKNWVLWQDSRFEKVIGELISGINFMAYVLPVEGKIQVTAISDEKIEEWSAVSWRISEYEEEIDTQALEICKEDGKVIRVHPRSGFNGYQKLIIRETKKMVKKEALL